MSVKKGYKQTELGVIPQDWRIINLDKNFSLKARIGWQGLTVAEYLDDGDFYLITGTDFKDGKIDWDNCVYVDRGRYIQDTNIQLKANDVLITKDGTIGKVAFITHLDKPTTLNSGVFVLRPKFGDMDEKFLFYLLRSFYFDDFLRRITAGSTITHLYQKDFVNFDLVLPSKPEQEKIAKALSDADAYIDSLERLIAKKQLIKEALMKKLLTPKESWIQDKLGNIANITRGASPRPIDSPVWFDDKSQVGWVRISDVSKSNRYLEFTEQKLSNLGILHSRFVPKNSLIMSICATIGKPIISKIDICIHDGFVVFDNLKIDKTYLFYYLKYIESDWRKNGQTGSQMNLNTDLINNTPISYPKSEDEQTEIANRLDDISQDIEETTIKLEKAQAIKQGVMQKLLTGEIRLINPHTQP